MTRSTNQKTLAKHLLSLRIALATAKLSWIRQFLDGRGFRALENVLDKTAIKQRGGKANDLDETLQSECVQCLRVLMNTEVTHEIRRVQCSSQYHITRVSTKLLMDGATGVYLFPLLF